MPEYISLHGNKQSCMYKVLPRKTTYSSVHTMDVQVHEQLWLVKKGKVNLTREELLDAIRTEYTFGCYCTHDCCGHWFTQRLSIKVVDKRNVVVNIVAARNY